MPAIRELAASAQFREDPEWIADQLVPKITPLQAQRAVETLCDLGLLVRSAAGRLVQADALLSTGPETRGLHIVAFHRAMTQRAIESIDLVPAAERDISRTPSFSRTQTDAVTGGFSYTAEYGVLKGGA